MAYCPNMRVWYETVSWYKHCNWSSIWKAAFLWGCWKIFELASDEDITLYVASVSFTNIYYILQRQKVTDILYLFDSLLHIVSVLPSDEHVIHDAIHSSFTDFEDAVQYYTALRANVSCIITRNKKDFTLSGIPVYTPTEFLSYKATLWHSTFIALIPQTNLKHRISLSNPNRSLRGERF